MKAKRLFRVSLKFKSPMSDKERNVWNSNDFYVRAYHAIEASNSVLNMVQERVESIDWLEIEELQGVWVDG